MNSSPQLAVEGAVLDGLADVVGADAFHAGEVAFADLGGAFPRRRSGQLAKLHLVDACICRCRGPKFN